MILQTKHKYLIRSVQSAICMLSLIGAAMILLAWHYPTVFNIKLSYPFIISAVVIVIYTWIHWSVRNDLRRGWKYALLHAKIRRELDTALCDSGFYVERVVLFKKCAVIPNIIITLNSTLTAGKIRIKNCIKLDKRLGELPISSALPKEYVLTKSYISDDCNDYIYEFELYKLEQLVFHRFQDFCDYNLKIDKYSLFLDHRHAVPMFHALVIGQTGSGKSYCLYNFVLQMLTKNDPWDLYIVDPKASGLYVMGRIINQNHVAAQLDNILSLLSEFEKRMQERKVEFGEKLLQKLDSDYRDFDLCPLCLIIDEYSSFRASLARYDKKTRDRADEIIGNIIREGRQIGCFCILAQQQTNAVNLPTELKENIPFKLILGMAERQTYITALGEYPDIAKRHFDRGQGILVYPEIASPEMPAVTAIATLDFDILGALYEIVDIKK